MLPRMAKLLDIEQFSKLNTPMDANYHPELDETDLVDAAGITQYKSMLGSLNWVNTLGRFDIAYALNTMSRYTMAPRVGHFKAMKRIFGYLRAHPHGRIVIDTGEAPVRKEAKVSSGYNWGEFYSDACEDVPSNVPIPKGEKVTLTCYVDMWMQTMPGTKSQGGQ